MNELSIDINNIILKKGSISFEQYNDLLDQANDLAQFISEVEVTDETVKQSKKLLAAVNNKVSEMDSKRIEIKKSILEPYIEFEEKVNNIKSVIKDANRIVKDKITALEEIEREKKGDDIWNIFEKRMRSYSFSYLIGFKDFLKPKHLNKSESLNKVEQEMVDWMEKVDSELAAINSLANAEVVLEEYVRTKDLSTALKLVNDRTARIEELQKVVSKKEKPVKSEHYKIEVYSEKDMRLLEIFMEMNKIKNNIKKVEL